MTADTLKEKQRTANSKFAIGGVSCSALTLVVKIPPIANLQNVGGNYEKLRLLKIKMIK